MSHKRQSLHFSFEFFPPRNSEMEEKLWHAMDILASFDPLFISVTYGAGGKTRDKTHYIVERVLRQTQLTPCAHLTCVGQTQEDLLSILKSYWDMGVRHIMALRGDMPDMGVYKPHKQGFQSTPEFIAVMKGLYDFDISCSAYPEKHPQSQSLKEDIELLKRKVDAGASRAVTQFCFDDDAFFRLQDLVAKAHINIPIIAGIIPTTNFPAIEKMAGKCGASIPDHIRQAFQDPDQPFALRREKAIDIALKQCENLRKHGIEHFHFYTLNQVKFTQSVCEALITSNG